MLEDIKTLIGEEYSEEYVETVYRLMEQYAKSYCNVTELSEGIRPILTAMTAGYILQQSRGEKKLVRGDTAIEYFSEQERQDFLDRFAQQLNRYRRVFV